MPVPLRALVTAPFRGPGLETVRGLAEVVLDPWIDHEPIRIYNAEQLAARVQDEEADLLVVESDLVAGPVLELPLRAIGACRGDPNNVDVAAATARGIPVLNAPGRNADAVAELAVGLLLAVSRGIVPADRDVRAGEIYRDGTLPYQRFRAWELRGRTVGVVGLGAVGRAAAWRFTALGMRTIASDPYASDASHTLDDLLAEADVVSMHAAVTPETHRMIGAPQFERMKEGAIFVNSARAQLHDTDALVDALRRGHLGGAALDHFEGELLERDHPLCSLPNVVLTPHIGGATYDTEVNHSTAIANGIVDLLAGRRPAEPRQPRCPERAGIPMSATLIKQQVLATAREMLESGLVQGTAGNLGARLPDGNVVLTPSSLDYREMTIDDLVVCDPDGTVVEGHRSPTSELALHLTTLARHPDLHATMHCHAKHCTMFALVRRPIPAVIEEFAVYVGARCRSPVTRPPVPSSSPKRWRHIWAIGPPCSWPTTDCSWAGGTPQDALHLAQLVERTAEIVHGALALGDLVTLPVEGSRPSPVTTDWVAVSS